MAETFLKQRGFDYVIDADGKDLAQMMFTRDRTSTGGFLSSSGLFARLSDQGAAFFLFYINVNIGVFLIFQKKSVSHHGQIVPEGHRGILLCSLPQYQGMIAGWNFLFAL